MIIILYFLLTWPVNGIPVYTGDSTQADPCIINDSAGGVYVAWDDNRTGDYDVYMQRIDSTGNLLWSSEGRLVCGAEEHQFVTQLVEDCAGGAILCWLDTRNSSDYDLYAQRVDENGNLLWGDGVIVCDALGSQFLPYCISDGHSGLLIAWQDYRGSDNDIYIQRLDSLGNNYWQPNGLPICVFSKRQDKPMLISLGNDHFLILWEDTRNGDTDIYGQHFDLNSNLYWESNGKKLISFPAFQSQPNAVAVDDSNFLILWEDCRNSDLDLYAQKFDWQGIAQFDSNGIAIAVAPNYQRNVQVVADGYGGSYVCWEDARPHFIRIKIQGQHLDASGNKLWGTEGIVITTEGAWRYHNPRMVVNDVSGVIIQWSRMNSEQIYAQSLDSLGNFLWSQYGVPVCAFEHWNSQYHITSDSLGGFYSVWNRNPVSFYPDIYLQRIYSDGTPGSCENASRIIDIMILPNPTRNRISFILPYADINLKIYDVTGREIFEQKISGNCFNWNCVDNIGRKISAGVYFVKFEAGDFSEVKKIILLR